MLLGETGLEETFEHLILDGLHLAAYGTHILDPQTSSWSTSSTRGCVVAVSGCTWPIAQ